MDGFRNRKKYFSFLYKDPMFRYKAPVQTLIAYNRRKVFLGMLKWAIYHNDSCLNLISHTSCTAPSFVQTAEPRPNSVSFASLIASFSSLNFITTTTGPKISSFTDFHIVVHITNNRRLIPEPPSNTFGYRYLTTNQNFCTIFNS